MSLKLKLIGTSCNPTDKDYIDYKILHSNEPNTLFIFDDNTERSGKGGDSCIRDESNAFGLTKGYKKITRNNKKKYGSFTDLNDIHKIKEVNGKNIYKKNVKQIIDDDIDRIKNAIKSNLDNKGNKRSRKYDTVRYCGKDENTDSYNFNPGKLVVSYINKKLRELINKKSIKQVKFSKKNNNSNSSKNTKKVKLYKESDKRRICKEENFKYVDVNGDGTCLFHALYKTYVGDYSKNTMIDGGYNLRKNILEHISKHQDKYIKLIRNFLYTDIRSEAAFQKNNKKVENIDEVLKKEKEEIIEYYKNWMKERDTYGGHIEILVFCDMMKVNVKVHTIQKGKLHGEYINDEVNESYKTLHLFHHLPVPHYSALFEIKKKPIIKPKPIKFNSKKIVIKNNKNQETKKISKKISNVDKLDKILLDCMSKISLYQSKSQPYEKLVNEIKSFMKKNKNVTYQNLNHFKNKFYSIKDN